MNEILVITCVNWFLGINQGNIALEVLNKVEFYFIM